MERFYLKLLIFTKENFWTTMDKTLSDFFTLFCTISLTNREKELDHYHQKVNIGVAELKTIEKSHVQQHIHKLYRMTLGSSVLDASAT